MTSEIGTAQTHRVPRMNPLLYGGYTTYYHKVQIVILYKEYRKTIWKGRPKRVIAPYLKYFLPGYNMLVSSIGHVKAGVNSGRPRSKAKQYMRSIVHKYREGKVKRTPQGE